MQTCCGRLFADEAALTSHQDVLHPHPYRIQVKTARSFERDLSELVEYARTFSADQRKSAAKSGDALPDGSFPIKGVQDLKNAIKLAGKASNPAKARAHIKKKAKALGQESLIPSEWAAESTGTGGVTGAPGVIVDPTADTQGLPYQCDYCGRRFASEVAEQLHESAVHGPQLPAGESQSGVSKKTGNYGVPSSVQTNDTSEGSPWIVDKADKPESYDDIRAIVQDALEDLTTNTLTGDYPYIYIADLSDSWVVFSRRGDYFQVDYTMDDSGKVTFTGSVQSVQRRTVYVPDPDSDEDDTNPLAATAASAKA